MKLRRRRRKGEAFWKKSRKLTLAKIKIAKLNIILYRKTIVTELKLSLLSFKILKNHSFLVLISSSTLPPIHCYLQPRN